MGDYEDLAFEDAKCYICGTEADVKIGEEFMCKCTRMAYRKDLMDKFIADNSYLYEIPIVYINEDDDE